MAKTIVDVDDPPEPPALPEDPVPVPLPVPVVVPLPLLPEPVDEVPVPLVDPPEGLLAPLPPPEPDDEPAEPPEPEPPPPPPHDTNTETINAMDSHAHTRVATLGSDVPVLGLHIVASFFCTVPGALRVEWRSKNVASRQG